MTMRILITENQYKRIITEQSFLINLLRNFTSFGKLKTFFKYQDDFIDGLRNGSSRHLTDLAKDILITAGVKSEFPTLYTKTINDFAQGIIDSTKNLDFKKLSDIEKKQKLISNGISAEAAGDIVTKMNEINKISKGGSSGIQGLSKQIQELIPKLTYFETAQGSKYIRTPEGQLRRWKSYHNNTQGADMGLQSWIDQSIFVSSKYEREGNIIYRMIDDGRKLAFQKDATGKIGVLVLDNNSWKPLTYGESAPNFVRANPNMKDKIVSFEYSKEPKVGFAVIDFTTKPSSTVLKSFHYGSPVTKIGKLEGDNIKLFFPY